MKKEEKTYYGKAVKELQQSETFKNYVPVFILKKKNKDDYVIYTVDKDASDNMIYYSGKMNHEINLDDYNNVSHAYDWSFDVNRVFGYLSDSYQIEFMDIQQHYGIWCQVNEYQQMGEHIDRVGLNNYIRFCMNNGINSQSMENLTGYKVDDIYPMYEEMNVNFKIIAQTEIGNRAIVLAEKINGQKEYVTWRTTPTRAGGYVLGHYFTDYKSAYKDFKERSQRMLDTYLNHTKIKTKPKECER